MRGAFYVTTALLVTNSIRTAAESDQFVHRQTSHYDDKVSGRMDTKSSPRKFLRGSRDQHEDLVLSATDEERMPELSTRIVGNSLTSVSEEMLDTVRKAAHLSFDLNAPPEETPRGALEAYDILRDKDLRTYTASHFEISSSQFRNKYAAQAQTNPDKASGSAIPKEIAGIRPKNSRISGPPGAMGVQSSNIHFEMKPRSIILSKNDVKKVHDLFLEYLQRNSAKFEPREDETKSFIGMVNWSNESRPSTSFVYKRYIERLMRMDLEDLKKLVFDSRPVLEKSLEDMLKVNLEDHKEIQLRLMRLLRLKRWVRMYRDFFNFCLSNNGVCSKFKQQTTLRVELRLMQNAQPSVNVDSNSAALPTEKASLTKPESEMFGSVVDAVKKANLSETDKKAWYEIVDKIYRDDDQFTPPNLSAFIADASNGNQPTALPTDVLKTLLRPDSSDWSSRRQKITELLEEATKLVQETEKNHHREIVVGEDEKAQVTAIREAFLKGSKFYYEPMLAVMKRMLYMFNWEFRPDPKLSVKPGVFLKVYVSRLDQAKLELALGPDRVKAVHQSEAGQRNPLLELQTEYLVLLLKTYDKFYDFCKNSHSLCVIPSRRPKKETRSRMRREQLLAKKRQKTS